MISRRSLLPCVDQTVDYVLDEKSRARLVENQSHVDNCPKECTNQCSLPAHNGLSKKPCMNPFIVHSKGKAATYVNLNKWIRVGDTKTDRIIAFFENRTRGECTFSHICKSNKSSSRSLRSRRSQYTNTNFTNFIAPTTPPPPIRYIAKL